MGSCSFASPGVLLLLRPAASRCRGGRDSHGLYLPYHHRGPVLVTLNPPFTLAIFAALLAAATTDGSSRAIGTTFCRLPGSSSPSPRQGHPPTTFSIILFASRRSPPVSPRTFASSSVTRRASAGASAFLHAQLVEPRQAPESPASLFPFPARPSIKILRRLGSRSDPLRLIIPREASLCAMAFTSAPSDPRSSSANKRLLASSLFSFIPRCEPK